MFEQIMVWIDYFELFRNCIIRMSLKKTFETNLILLLKSNLRYFCSSEMILVQAKISLPPNLPFSSVFTQVKTTLKINPLCQIFTQASLFSLKLRKDNKKLFFLYFFLSFLFFLSLQLIGYMNVYLKCKMNIKLKKLN